MNDPRSDGYFVLAVCIATAAVFATIVQSYQILGDFNPDTTATLSIVGGALAQICLALSMLCAVIIGRHMVANSPTWPPSIATDDTIEDGIIEDGVVK